MSWLLLSSNFLIFWKTFLTGKNSISVPKMAISGIMLNRPILKIKQTKNTQKAPHRDNRMWCLVTLFEPLPKNTLQSKDLSHAPKIWYCHGSAGNIAIYSLSKTVLKDVFNFVSYLVQLHIHREKNVYPFSTCASFYL